MEDALAAFKRGEPLVVVDSTSRKDECDLVFAAEHATTERMAFAIRFSTGIIYAVAGRERLDRFGLYPATRVNTERFAVDAYVSTTFLPGSSTGLSAADRAATARALCNGSNGAASFSKPGHMFPVVAAPGGVLERPGHTEAAYDLCRLGGCAPVACLTELTHDDGSMLRRDAALDFGRRHGIPAVTVEQVVEYRRAHPGFPEAPGASGAPSIRGLDLPAFDGTGLKVAIVSARWNAAVCDSLVDAAREAMASCNVRDVVVEHVAGSYEIPSAAQVLLESKRFDGVICVGCLIKDESTHFEFVSHAVAQAIMRLNLDYKVPVVYGILSAADERQARAKSGMDGPGNSIGKEWGITCVESCLLRKRSRVTSRL
eukprot:CAMPEP_0179249798 /NCGR_PEP_ID=MMETSP0797-20121207/20834_1 /TAXON_ID=47934 /ORGANISM="Dinophysis acuminata, Strain DAEP01" /LENGTH=371 /DNA_ID=CAMNT_0020957507 /DNA_START=83 /DNA_END=1198 /DNA_ORIENTATION=+